MRVLHVIDKLNTGGAEQVFVDLTHLLIDAGVDVAVLLFDGTGDMSGKLDKRLPVYILDRVNKFSIIKMWEMHKVCSQYDIVHVHMRHCYQYARLVQILFSGRYKLIVHDHYGIDKNIPASFKHIFKPKYYIGVCSSLTQWAADSLKIDPQHIFLLRNIVIPDNGTSYVPNKRTNGMMIANISRVKNIEFAIEVFKKKGWSLDIYGNSRDDVYYQELVDQIGNDRSIRIIGNTTNFSGIYPNYSIAIHCSKSESGPLVLMEYMAAGIPFIAYRTGEVADVVSDALPSLFMDNFDTDDWVQRIDEIIEEPGLPERMKVAFKEHFSAGKYVDTCKRIYEKVSC